MRKIFVIRYMNEKGFTFVEMLFAFSVFLLTIHLTLSIIPTIHIQSTIGNSEEIMEWEMFIHQSKQELRGSRHFKVTSNKLVFINAHNEMVEYEKYKHLLRRKVEGKGHEVILQNIDSIHFKLKPTSISIRSETISGIQLEAEIFLMHDKKESDLGR